MVKRTHWYSKSIDLGYPVDDKSEVREQVHPLDPSANLVSSLLAGDRWEAAKPGTGMHAPAFDLDLPCTLIPSSTPDHYHLLIDKAMPWWRYRILLRVMVFAGLVEKKYYQHSIRRGMTMLRLPHVHKGVDYREDDAFAARDEEDRRSHRNPWHDAGWHSDE